MMVRLVLISLLLPALTWAQVDESSVGVESDNKTTMSVNPVHHTSREGEFRITFPGGCGKTVTRVRAEDLPDVDGRPAVNVIFTFCDRYQEKGEGCSVTTHFNVTSGDGGYPEPKQVIDRMMDLLKSMGVSIQKQSPLHKDLDDGTVIEGLEIFAAEGSGSGQAWLRGLIYEGDIYVLSAWKNTGGLWDDPDYITFFNSFQPGIE